MEGEKKKRNCWELEQPNKEGMARNGDIRRPYYLSSPWLGLISIEEQSPSVKR